jgi:NitT/TauT family transport system substrate-binding protein
VSALARVLAALVAGLAVLGAAADGRAQDADKVELQLKWLPQAQFAGYYAAKAKGFYRAERLDVTIRPGGPDVVPEEVVNSRAAQLGIDWLPSLLASREAGMPLVNIAQVFATSGTRQIAFKSSGIKGPGDLRGRRVSVWFGGNEFELFAALNKHGIDPNKDVTLVPQPFDMSLLLQKKVEASAVMTYNEYKQVLDAGVRPDDLVVIDFNREGTAMLQDGIVVREDWLREHKAVAARFLRASLRGWEHCRDTPGECVDIVLKEMKGGKKEQQAWMMAEVNKLVWGPPAPKTPVGRMDPDAFARTAEVALKFGVIKKRPDAAAYTHEIWDLARKK